MAHMGPYPTIKTSSWCRSQTYLLHFVSPCRESLLSSSTAFYLTQMHVGCGWLLGLASEMWGSSNHHIVREQGCAEHQKVSTLLCAEMHVGQTEEPPLELTPNAVMDPLLIQAEGPPAFRRWPASLVLDIGTLLELLNRIFIVWFYFCGLWF